MLSAVRAVTTRDRDSEAGLRRGDLPLLLAITVLGGIVGPVLMLSGLARLSGVAGSLLLNLEAPFTILLAIIGFGEHLGRRELVAAGGILGGALLLSWAPGEVSAHPAGVALIAGACLCWAIDNNLSQRLSVRDPVVVARAKTLGAGACTLALALVRGDRPTSAAAVAVSLVVGGLGYGASLAFDQRALRLIGAAREAAYFATAPFLGALLAVPIAGERISGLELGAGALMGCGVAVLLREKHAHAHVHEPLEHEHAHVHDEHHSHEHTGSHAGFVVDADAHSLSQAHSHPHVHAFLAHDHQHVSDAHHRHVHD